ncbi:hypothetical protein [Terricaulis sp.]|uniref:hypothetical protein n=1 Tax=Terricaulis sp. TaxID=2768686 RepID=UPI0037842858
MSIATDAKPTFRAPLFERLFLDRTHRAPRLWSNKELASIGQLFSGDIVNVSAWRDEDKAGRFYRDYFTAARSYTLTNYNADMRGFQGRDGEIFLNLESPLPDPLRGRFDVVFNHTTLEHVYEFRTAFANLCTLSRDAVIVVVPWLQPYHGDYGDYWRFSPMAVARLFAENGMTPARITWNKAPGTSVYIFAVGVKDRARWDGVFAFDVDPQAPDFLAPPSDFAGRDALPKRAADLVRAAARRSGVGRLIRGRS